MTGHTPATHTIREAYVKFQSDLDRLTGRQQPVDVYYAEFDRWLKEVTDAAWYEGQKEAW